MSRAFRRRGSYLAPVLVVLAAIGLAILTSIDAIAEIIDISASHLAHLFRSETGMSVKDYLTRVRVAVAQDLLAGTDEKLDAVAARVGFVDTSHLAHVFQRITGRPPSTYRRA